MNRFDAIKSLPDITSENVGELQPPLEWVGMTQLPLSFELLDSRLGNHRCQGYAEVGVDLVDARARGIHMSRLYLGLEGYCREQPLSPLRLQDLLQQLLDTQLGLSLRAHVSLAFELLVSRPALHSRLRGFKAYPVRLHAFRTPSDSGLALELSIPYSSTCPCSTSLARAHLKESLNRQFPADRIGKAELYAWLDRAGEDFPTPHSQRSFARVRLALSDPQAPIFNLLQWIDGIEECLQTPVQTAVKREDELAFARRNGANLMFCEDAARRIKRLLESRSELGDYWLEVEHQESLHAHNAVARAARQTEPGRLYPGHWNDAPSTDY